MHTHRQQVLGHGSAWNLFAMLVAFALLAAGCESVHPRDRPWREPIETPGGDVHGGEGGETTQESSSEEQPLVLERRTKGKRSLRIHMNADPGSLNPLDSPSRWALRIMMDNVFETLIRYRPAPDSKVARYQAGLAQRWTISPGGREIRLVLDEGARWQDGKPVTALDVQFSLEAAMTRRGGADHHRVALADVSAVEIINRSQVRVRMERPNAFVLRELASVPILPEHLYRRALDQRRGDWVGSGPFAVRRDGEHVRLERRSDYWGAAPGVDEVIFVREQDAALALRAAKEGQIDIIPELIRAHYPEQLDIPGVSKDFSVLRLEPPTFSYVVLDTKEAPFDDANMRRAVSHLIDRASLVEHAGGLARAVPGPIWLGGPGHGASSEVPAFDPEEAAKHLDLAGFRDDDGDGVRKRETERLMITVLATEGPHDMRDTVLAALRKAGFVIDLRVGSAAVLRNRLNEGEFDLAFVTWSGDVDRDLTPLLGSAGKNNYGRYQSPVVDELLEKIKQAWDPGERVELLGTLAQLLARSMPLVALLAPDPRGLVNRRVQGLAVWGGWFAIRDLRFAEDAE